MWSRARQIVRKEVVRSVKNERKISKRSSFSTSKEV